MIAVEQVARHVRAHDAEADETDVCHMNVSLLGRNGTAGVRLARRARCAAGDVLQPAEPFRRGGAGFVFAADVAVVIEPVEQREQERVVDLARARFVAAGLSASWTWPIDARLRSIVAASSPSMRCM
jgi:hypothetical protein